MCVHVSQWSGGGGGGSLVQQGEVKQKYAGKSVYYQLSACLKQAYREADDNTHAALLAGAFIHSWINILFTHRRRE